MKRSTNRILTTHVGSLPRPVDLLEMNDAKGSGRSIDQSAWAARVKTAVLEIVRLQRECGVDIVNDGELSKSSWSSYVNERLSGFAESVSRGQGSLAKGRDKRTFQEFYDEYDRIQPFRTVNGSRWTDVICNAPILYTGHYAVQTGHRKFENRLRRDRSGGGIYHGRGARLDYYQADQPILPKRRSFSFCDCRRDED